MKLVYHIGLHSTDEDRALRCLLQNAEKLAEVGTIAPAPGQFRPVLRQAMIHLRGAPASRHIQEQVLDEVIDHDTTERLLFSNDSFLCVPKRAITGGALYPLAEERAPWIRNLFPDDPAEFAFGIRNPATLIPALQARFAEEEDFAAYLARIQPEDLSWADMVARFQRAVPDCPLTIWCNEDTPLIWYDILEALTSCPNALELEGVHEFHRTIMSEEGVERMERYFESHPSENGEQRRRVIATFLEEFATPEAVEEEYDLPGWTADRIARLSERYEADVAEVAAMEGVRFLRA
ncbi:hypothetical protein [Tropicimonas sediminicola]|uniref:Sulfotransferase family protein n=1 Tax=Tropicimonas sediminicola TaxID=1031541 RepID=A0A239FDD6_9RHOB|nr:hypothetical protein [Tropicimonas sediminicola]SNS54518.1 hypothetical protein SAMN05421757_102607 [Tropicimonas sediminicola]